MRRGATARGRRMAHVSLAWIVPAIFCALCCVGGTGAAGAETDPCPPTPPAPGAGPVSDALDDIDDALFFADDDEEAPDAQEAGDDDADGDDAADEEEEEPEPERPDIPYVGKRGNSGKKWTDAEKDRMQALWDQMPVDFLTGVTEVRRGKKRLGNPTPAAYDPATGVLTVYSDFFKSSRVTRRGPYRRRGQDATLFHELAHHWETRNGTRITGYRELNWTKDGDTWRRTKANPKLGTDFIYRPGKSKGSKRGQPRLPNMMKKPEEDFATAVEMFRFAPDRLRSSTAGQQRSDWIRDNVFGGRVYTTPDTLVRPD